ncbi:DUF722 domain-containing protein [Lactovum miscens]|uniref:Uncharacterized protein n=1 Tax=Lactovum miscens TaxID=190387 RepID=A0A841C4J2_9LACT|nr:hypothetical protein [Lactovum miscens]
MASKIDILLENYFLGNIQKWIDARIHQITYKEKMDNLGIKSQSTGISPQESQLMAKEELEKKINSDVDIMRWRDQIYWIEYWLPSYPDVERIYRTYYSKQEKYLGVSLDLDMSERSVYSRRSLFKETLCQWIR